MVLVKKLPAILRWNYITTSDKKMYLYKFKTVKSVNPQEWDLSCHPEILTCIKKLLRHRSYKRNNIDPEEGQFMLLNSRNCKKMSRVGLSLYLNKIFNRKVSSTMLRRIYLSENFPVTRGQSVADRKAVLPIMGQKHLEIQDCYRKIIDK